MLLYSIKNSNYNFFQPTTDTDKNCKVLWIYILKKMKYLNLYSILRNFQLDFAKKAQTGLYYEYLLLFYFT